MSYKKLSFLYLVFILFLFFSSPGQYVVHYDQMKVTQNELNLRLFNKIKNFESENKSEIGFKSIALECVLRLDSLKKVYNSFAARYAILGDKLKENQFSEKQVRNGKWSDYFEKTNLMFNKAFYDFSGNSLDADLLKIESFTGQRFNSNEFYLKELPNGVFESLIEHLKTVYLTNAVNALYKEKIVIPKYEQINLEDAKFIQKFKRKLVLGNKFELSIKPIDSNEIPLVKINGLTQNPVKHKRGTFDLEFWPNSAGKYSVEVNIGNQRLFSGFEVLKPEFRFIMEKSKFHAYTGEKLLISLDTQYFPGKSVNFRSDKAEIQRLGEKLYVTPNENGLFYVVMYNGSQKVDEIALYSHEPESIDVGLLDISGQVSSLNGANRLESLNTFWQVVSFRMTVVKPDGKKETLRSATRYLRNDLRAAEQNAPKGSVLIFDEIKLVGKNKGLIKLGKSIVLRK